MTNTVTTFSLINKTMTNDKFGKVQCHGIWCKAKKFTTLTDDDKKYLSKYLSPHDYNG